MSEEEKPKSKKRPPNYSAKRWVNQNNVAERFSQPHFKQTWSSSPGVAEDRVIKALDMKKSIEKLLPLLEKLDNGKMDAQQLFEGVSNQAAVNLLSIALSGDNEKNRLDATKHLLALAGHNPATKHEISRVDPNTPKEALLSIISGSKKELEKAGIEIVDDRGDGDDDEEESED